MVSAQLILLAVSAILLPLPALLRAALGGVSVLVALFLSPSATRALSTRPLYIDELTTSDPQETASQRRERERAIRVFERAVAVCTALAAALVVDYFAVVKVRQSPESLAEAAAVVGGIASIAKRLHVAIAKVLLWRLNWRRRCKRELEMV